MADKARAAMAAAARAAAESMRANRNEADTKDSGGQAAKDSLQAKSGSGSSPDGSGARSGELPGLRAARSGDWGRLPKKMAEELSQVRREEVSAEYRQQVETYYRVLSERAKK
jgi:Flp pilus assembly protein TadG